MLNIIRQTNNKVNPLLHKDLIQSYNHYYKFNDYMEELPRNAVIEDLWEILNVNELFIVLRHNKFIGFFVHTDNKTNKEISFQIFLSPFACPKSNVSITKCAVSNCILQFINSDELENLEFITNHPLLATAVKNIIPNLEIIMLTPRHIICHKKISDIDKEYFTDFIKVAIESETPNNYDNYKLLR